MKHHQNIATDATQYRRLVADMPPWEEKSPEQEERDSMQMLGWCLTGLVVLVVAAVVVWWAP